MSNDQTFIKALFEKYVNGSASPEEVKQLFNLISDKQYDEEIKSLLLGELQETELQDKYDTDRWSKVFNKVKTETELMEFEEKPVRHLGFRRLAIAASLAACLGIGFYFYQHQFKPAQTSQFAKNDIQPGGNKAILILANGKKISITDSKNGTIAQQAGVQVNKTKNGQLVYVVSAASGLAQNSGKTAEVAYNTIETPRGGQYQVVLPDGSHVWLNAASSITYPVVFNKNDRTVKLTGEAYFEVVHNAANPFRVETNGQTIQDIGTSFNINAYNDEPVIKTTLIEGSIKVDRAGQTKILKPGQQAITHSGEPIMVQPANTDMVTAWNKGKFYFEKTSLRELMRQVSRWYNIDVVYEGDVSDDGFTGQPSRNEKLTQMLKILQYGDVHFKIEPGKGNSAGTLVVTQ